MHEAASQRVTVATGRVSLPGDLTVPPGALGLVLFAHGSGSGRGSPRNRHVAAALQRAGLATLLFDLLTAGEAAADVETEALRFDIARLAGRVAAATVWARSHPASRALRQGYFGASTGAAAALAAAAEQPEAVRAVVCRGGRPDLAGEALTRVRAPTLLIVGSEDRGVIDLNRAALDALPCERQLVLINGATHLFEEPGTLDEVARLATAWFARHLGAARAARR